MLTVMGVRGDLKVEHKRHNSFGNNLAAVFLLDLHKSPARNRF